MKSRLTWDRYLKIPYTWVYHPNCTFKREHDDYPISKVCLQISVPSQWYVPVSIVLCEIDIHRASLVVRRASRTARILTLEVLVEAWTVPARFPHVDVPFSTESDFQQFELHLNFHFYILFFSTDPGDGYIPCRRALDAEHCKYHENSLPVSMVCTHLKGLRFFFQMFFSKEKKWLSILKVRRIELLRKAEPTRFRTHVLRMFHPSRVAFPGSFHASPWDGHL